MKAIKFLALGAALGFASQAALAFQETTAGTAAPAVKAAEQAPTAGIAMPAPSLRSSGPEIRVPGLGTIGSLPKLDFGLELLYGASEPKGAREELNKDQNDLQIRGTVKYKFNN